MDYTLIVCSEEVIKIKEQKEKDVSQPVSHGNHMDGWKGSQLDQKTLRQ